MEPYTVSTASMEQAKAILEAENATCVIFGEGVQLLSQERGVKPLLQWLDEGRLFDRCTAADRVVGNGAAFLYVLLGVREIYANVLSRAALETLQRFRIRVACGEFTERIRNRTGDGCCPIEEAVAGETDPNIALTKIRNRLALLKQKGNESHAVN